MMFIVLSCPVVFQLREGLSWDLQETLREAMLHVEFCKADVQVVDGTQLRDDQTLKRAGISTLVFTAIK